MLVGLWSILGTILTVVLVIIIIYSIKASIPHDSAEDIRGLFDKYLK